MFNRASVLVIFLLLANTASQAASDEALPSLELLEFLADWQNDDGKWLDPIQVQEMLDEEYAGLSKEDSTHE